MHQSSELSVAFAFCRSRPLASHWLDVGSEHALLRDADDQKSLEEVPYIRKCVSWSQASAGRNTHSLTWAPLESQGHFQ